MSVQRRTTSRDRHGAPRHGGRLRRVVGLWTVGVTLLGVSGDPTGAVAYGAPSPLPLQAQELGPPSQLRQRQVAFLHRLREADPRYQTIDKAVLNAQNELGVILDRRVELEAVQPLMRTLLTQMAKAFPGQDLLVIAYAPSEPPLKIGTAQFNARTRQMTYTPAVRQ
jgi:hypothetical protein